MRMDPCSWPRVQRGPTLIKSFVIVIYQNKEEIDNSNNAILDNLNTYLDDVKVNKTTFGIGFDIHKLKKNKTLYLGGIKIPFHSGLQGHSDGDVMGIIQMQSTAFLKYTNS